MRVSICYELYFYNINLKKKKIGIIISALTGGGNFYDIVGPSHEHFHVLFKVYAYSIPDKISKKQYRVFHVT